MKNNKNLVNILISQHNVLRDELHLISDLIIEFNEISSFVKINQLLNQFEKDLDSHLDLENNVFYVDLIKKMNERNLDTSKTEKFIFEMKDIEKTIKDFLRKFDSPDLIETNQDEFKIEFRDISNALRLRVESEESGIYEYWQALSI